MDWLLTVEQPFPAYCGDEPYIFVSYAHEDEVMVYPEIQWLKDQGFNIWYDEGISPGTEWRNELAESIEGSSLFVYFITPNSTESDNCKREVNFSVDHKIPLLSVHLQQTDLSSGMDLTLSTTQAILKYDLSEQVYRQKLLAGVGDHTNRGIAVVKTQREQISLYLPRQVLIFAVLFSLILASVVTWNLKPIRNLPEPGVIRFAHHLAPTERIWRGNLVERSAVVLSPDGRRLVYVASRGDGTRQLYLRSRDQIEGKPIPGTEIARSPFFSPDGEWVVLFTPTEMKKVSLSSGVIVTITDVIPSSSGGSWSSDGNILFNFAVTQGLSTIPADGGILKPLTVSEKRLGHHFPHPLPGDKELLFTIMQSHAFGHTGIAVLSLETGQVRMLLDEGTHPHYLSSGYLVYALRGTLQAVPFDLDSLEITGTPVQLLDGVATRFGADFSLSVDGTLAYVPGTWGWPDRSLVWVNRDGKIVDKTCQPKHYRFPRISPNNQRVAVSINSRRKGRSDIWICELALNNTLMRLTVDESFGNHPVWSPDGKRMTYSATNQSSPNLREIAADGTGKAEWLLQKQPGIWPASWSPDGTTLLFTEENYVTNMDIWLLPASEGSKAEPWLQTPAFEGKPVFSSDGRWIAFQSDETGQHEVFVRSFPDIGQKYQISIEGGTEPVWSADGAELFYRNGDKMMVVAVMTLRGFSWAEPKLLFESKYWLSNLTTAGASYDVASNGRFLMITESEQDLTEINVVINWEAEVKRLVSIDSLR